MSAPNQSSGGPDGGAGTVSAAAATVAGDAVLRLLRVALHVAFAGLLVLALVQLTLDGPGTPRLVAAYACACVLAVVYLAGTVAEKRYAVTGTGPDPGRAGPYWLAAVTFLWLLLLLISADFSWLAFPLFFLDLHLLRTVPALAAVTAMTAAVVAAQGVHSGGFTLAVLLGPVVGALFAVVMGFAYAALHGESVNQRRALAELRRTRGQLAASQHRAGVLAERERLAREIHDTLAQGFSSIVLMSRAAGAALESGQADLARERIATVQATASENLAEARKFVRGLTEPATGSGTLIAGLERLCADNSRQAASGGQPLECTLRVDGEPVDLDARYETTLLRAAQASLANVRAHSCAHTAVLTLSYAPDAVTLDVFDDGAGFSTATLPDVPRRDGSGFGLLSLRERAADLGGVLSIESAPGEGAVVAVRLPLPAAEQPAQPAPAKTRT
ncbi:sensor histidine kinase [Arthrobacter yangruifuii]|uniref:Oxygen sensor histidine kinase NreB n=1 Tax=Arthrobacter yangruifuii TaxID=2606616 RepID=A0A5N6MJL0_9MICC|nr:sensor histidine kinase [Arthrobacter yangruifuii]KAD3632958.1 sensor histidine kinase [Arthrobacter yangruifuii]